MTDHDRKAARREIADALLKALERRHEVLDLIVEADNKAAAVEAIGGLLGTSHVGAEAVLGLSFDQVTKESRKIIQTELEDLNKQLSFTLGERPASSGDSLELRAFSAEEDRDIFAVRTQDMGAAGDGSGGPAGNLDDEIRSIFVLVRPDDVTLVWLRPGELRCIFERPSAIRRQLDVALKSEYFDEASQERLRSLMTLRW